MSISITSQPGANVLMAAYRPIVFGVSITPKGPAMYCDIYFNGSYYKTISKTQGSEFDIQDAAKEFLKKYIAPNGSAQIYNAAPMLASCYVKIRSTITNADGFLVPDAPVPVQATDQTAAVPGGGIQSNTFYILNTTLQQEDNQSLTAHLNAFKNGNWGAATYPLTHRPNGVIVGRLQSDYFPIVSDQVPTGIKLHVKFKTLPDYVVYDGGSTCVPAKVTGNMPNALNGENYYYTIPISGSGPFTLSNVVKPSWMAVNIVDNSVVITGPASTGSNYAVSFTVTNDCGSDSFSDTFNVFAVNTCAPVSYSNTINLPNGKVGVAYSFSFNLSGTAPFSFAATANKPSWMTVAISGNTVNFSGTPDVEGTGVTVAFTVNNPCGSKAFSRTINVAPADVVGATNYDLHVQPAAQTIGVYCQLNGVNTAAPFTTTVSITYSYTPSGGGNTVHNNASADLVAGQSQVIVVTGVPGTIIDASITGVVPTTDGTNNYSF